MSPLFAAAAEATEEAIYNAILRATTVTSSRGKLEAIPLEGVMRVLKKYNTDQRSEFATELLHGGKGDVR
jgi:D-aminopeptidase